MSKIEKLYFSIHCAQSSLSIVFYSDNSNGQESQESPGLSFDASYKLQRKLHHNDNPGEVSLSNNVMNNCKPIKSGTKPVLKSKDDFWVGDGADVECNFHGIAKQGTNPAEFFGDMTVQVSSKSAARKRRCEAKKVAVFTVITATAKNHRNLLVCRLMQVTSFGKNYIITTIQERFPCRTMS